MSDNNAVTRPGTLVIYALWLHGKVRVFRAQLYLSSTVDGWQTVQVTTSYYPQGWYFDVEEWDGVFGIAAYDRFEDVRATVL